MRTNTCTQLMQSRSTSSSTVGTSTTEGDCTQRPHGAKAPADKPLSRDHDCVNLQTWDTTAEQRQSRTCVNLSRFLGSRLRCTLSMSLPRHVVRCGLLQDENQLLSSRRTQYNPPATSEEEVRSSAPGCDARCPVTLPRHIVKCDVLTQRNAAAAVANLP